MHVFYYFGKIFAVLSKSPALYIYITGKSTWPTKGLLEPVKCHEQIIPVPFNMCPFHVENLEVGPFRIVLSALLPKNQWNMLSKNQCRIAATISPWVVALGVIHLLS